METDLNTVSNSIGPTLHTTKAGSGHVSFQFEPCDRRHNRRPRTGGQKLLASSLTTDLGDTFGALFEGVDVIPARLVNIHGQPRFNTPTRHLKNNLLHSHRSSLYNRSVKRRWNRSVVTGVFEPRTGERKSS